MIKHTPGKWEAYNHYVWTKDKQNIANCKNVQEGNPITPEESYANARLIAAAPELLERLKESNAHLLLTGYNGQEWDNERLELEYRKNELTIAKAEGKE